MPLSSASDALARTTTRQEAEKRFQSVPEVGAPFWLLCDGMTGVRLPVQMSTEETKVHR